LLINDYVSRQTWKNTKKRAKVGQVAIVRKKMIKKTYNGNVRIFIQRTFLSVSCLKFQDHNPKMPEVNSHPSGLSGYKKER